MPFQRAHSIDELYDRVKAYDRVVTADAPLSLALNRRIDAARLGRFAATPRMIASGEFRPADKRKLFLEVIDQTDLDWKLVEYLIEHIVGCWEETGDIDNILTYDSFDTSATREVLAVVKDIRSTHRDLAEYKIDEGTRVAVIGEDHLTTLDRSILPSSYDAIPMFDPDAAIDLPPVRIFDSPAAIVQGVIENVTPAVASDIAVVMDGGGQFPPLIESALSAADIPYYGGPEFIDDLGVRTYLRLLRLALSGQDVLLADLRPVLTYLGFEARVADTHKRLDRLDDPNLRPVSRFVNSVETATFDEALKFLTDHGDRPPVDLRDELDRLNLLDQRITADRVDDLAFYLQTFDIPFDRDDEGVLLADPSSAAFVDRPVVVFLGMDEGWTQRIPDRPWIDVATRDRQHLEAFQLLLQSGQQQYYLVQETAGGTPVTPCLYFHELLDGTIETFGDLPNRRHGSPQVEETTAFTRIPLEVPRKPIRLLSQSSLNTFVNCPRDWMFGRIVEQPDRDYFTKGNLVHDFAEFAVTHPDFVDTLDLDEVVAFMVSELSPFVDELELDTTRTEFEVAVEVIIDFLEAHPPKERRYARYVRSDRHENVFADHYDLPADSPIAERSFANHAIGASGKVDLIHSPTRIVDYKSSSRKPSAAKIVRQSGIDPIDDEPDFQAPMYLAHHRQEVPDRDLEFLYVYVLAALDDAVTGEVTLDDTLIQVPYHDVTFVEWAATEDAFDALCAGVAESNDRRKTLERLTVDRYAAFFADHPMPDVEEKDAILAAPFHTDFVRFTKDHVGDNRYVENGIESALKCLMDQRACRLFADDLDAIEAFLKEQRALLNRYRSASFPVGDPNRDRLNHRDLIRPDD